MKPYYERAGITLYLGDCREVLPNVTADVLVTDPPYGIGLTTKTSDFRGSTAFDNGESLKASVLYEDSPESIRALVSASIPIALSRVSRGLVFCGPAMLWQYPEPSALGAVYVPNGAGRCSWGFQCAQPILFYGKDPWLSSGKGSRPNSFRTEQPNKEHFDHPCPKPIEWMKWAVYRASMDGESVLDPFAGSGTTLAAAVQMNRPAIGIEIEEKYCEIAARRIDRELAQGDLFVKRVD